MKSLRDPTLDMKHGPKVRTTSVTMAVCLRGYSEIWKFQTLAANVPSGRGEETFAFILGSKTHYQQTVRHGDFKYGVINEAWWSRSELEPLMTNMTREGHTQCPLG